LFVALGIADGVFEDITKSSDLDLIRFSAGRDAIRLRIRPDKMDLPILRRLDMSGAVSPDLIMTSSITSLNT